MLSRRVGAGQTSCSSEGLSHAARRVRVGGSDSIAKCSLTVLLPLLVIGACASPTGVVWERVSLSTDLTSYAIGQEASNLGGIEMDLDPGGDAQMIYW